MYLIAWLLVSSMYLDTFFCHHFFPYSTEYISPHSNPVIGLHHNMALFLRVAYALTYSEFPPSLLQLTLLSRWASSATLPPSWRQGSGLWQPERRWPVMSWAEWWPETERTGLPSWKGGSHFYHKSASQHLHLQACHYITMQIHTEAILAALTMKCMTFFVYMKQAGWVERFIVTKC